MVFSLVFQDAYCVIKVILEGLNDQGEFVIFHRFLLLVLLYFISTVLASQFERHGKIGWW